MDELNWKFLLNYSDYRMRSRNKNFFAVAKFQTTNLLTFVSNKTELSLKYALMLTCDFPAYQPLAPPEGSSPNSGKFQRKLLIGNNT